MAEILDGAQKRGIGGRRRRRLLDYLDALDVVSYSFNLRPEYARVRDVSRRAGRELAVADAWIAATAVFRRAR